MYNCLSFRLYTSFLYHYSVFKQRIVFLGISSFTRFLCCHHQVLLVFILCRWKLNRRKSFFSGVSRCSYPLDAIYDEWKPKREKVVRLVSIIITMKQRNSLHMTYIYIIADLSLTCGENSWQVQWWNGKLFIPHNFIITHSQSCPVGDSRKVAA